MQIKIARALEAVFIEFQNFAWDILLDILSLSNMESLFKNDVLVWNELANIGEPEKSPSGVESVRNWFEGSAMLYRVVTARSAIVHIKC